MTVTFYQHELVGANHVDSFLRKYKGIDKKTRDLIVLLIRKHGWHFLPETKDETLRNWLFLFGRDTWQLIFFLRLMDRKGNRATAGKPLITSDFKLNYERCKQIAQSIKIWKEDLKLRPNSLQNIPRTKHEQCYVFLLDAVNKDPKLNCESSLRALIQEFYEI